MLVIWTWLGALLVIAGVVYMAMKAIWKGPMSGPNQTRPGLPRDTLEPPGRGGEIGVFALSRNWPGLVLMAVGGILLLTGVVV